MQQDPQELGTRQGARHAVQYPLLSEISVMCKATVYQVVVGFSGRSHPPHLVPYLGEHALPVGDLKLI